MRPAETDRLSRECAVFCAYLCGLKPSAYLLAKYADAHSKVPDFHPRARFDRLLVALAATGPRWARLADTYARVFAPRATLRKKLILLVALLEASAAHAVLDMVDSGGRLVLFFQIVLRGALFGLCVVLAAPVFLPLQLALGTPANRTGAKH